MGPIPSVQPDDDWTIFLLEIEKGHKMTSANIAILKEGSTGGWKWKDDKSLKHRFEIWFKLCNGLFSFCLYVFIACSCVPIGTIKLLNVVDFVMKSSRTNNNNIHRHIV